MSEPYAQFKRGIVSLVVSLYHSLHDLWARFVRRSVANYVASAILCTIFMCNSVIANQSGSESDSDADESSHVRIGTALRPDFFTPPSVNQPVDPSVDPAVNNWVDAPFAIPPVTNNLSSVANQFSMTSSAFSPLFNIRNHPLGHNRQSTLRRRNVRRNALVSVQNDSVTNSARYSDRGSNNWAQDDIESRGEQLNATMSSALLQNNSLLNDFFSNVHVSNAQEQNQPLPLTFLKRLHR